MQAVEDAREGVVLFDLLQQQLEFGAVGADGVPMVDLSMPDVIISVDLPLVFLFPADLFLTCVPPRVFFRVFFIIVGG